jgi:malate dehydrogenase
MAKSILHIAVTGGAGQFAYQLLFRIASGELFGTGQPIALHIIELPEVLPALEGVKMELEDCAFPLLASIEITSNPYQGFKNADYIFLIGAKPRGPGMERGDLLIENGKIFVEQGKATQEGASPNVRVFVVCNPCNTNCLIAMSHAPRISPKNFFAMTRLDQNRASFLLAAKGNVPVKAVSNMTIWGNHSATQFPDFIHAKVNGKAATAAIQDRHWLENEFIELVQKRGAAIIKARGKSSAGSAAQALIDSVRDTIISTPNGNWFSSAIYSKGNPYAISENIVFSFPCRRDESGEIAIVPNLEIDEFLADKLKATERELLNERDLVKHLINKDGYV